VFLHIGLPKTGTTSIQAALQESSEDLAAAGVQFPFGRHFPQRLAAYDLMGRRLPGDDGRRIPGSFKRLVREVDAWDGPTTVVSEELLSLAGGSAIKRVMRALDGREVHLVMTVRDLGRTICSSWQQQIFQGQTYSWPDFLAALREPGQGPAGAGVTFWLRQDPVRVAAKWSEFIPAERVHIVTVPAESRGGDGLLDRFAELLGVPAGALHLNRPPLNQSVGPVELEVLRRLNIRVADRVAKPKRAQVVPPDLLARLGDRASGTLQLPAGELHWVRERAEASIAGMRGAGFTLHGSWEDLLPSSADAERGVPPTDSELLDATERALLSLTVAFGRQRRRIRRASLQAELVTASAGDRLSVSARTLGYRAKLAAVDAADHNRIVAWAARRYLGKGPR
jgi:hypothetical protein